MEKITTKMIRVPQRPLIKWYTGVTRLLECSCVFERTKRNFLLQAGCAWASPDARQGAKREETCIYYTVVLEFVLPV